MNRRQALGSAVAGSFAFDAPQRRPRWPLPAQSPGAPLPVPKEGKIKVAFAISNGANVMDLAGPWETLGDLMLPNGDMPFELYTIAETTQIVAMTGGLRIEPTYSFDSIPFMPNVVVVGAQSNRLAAFMELLRYVQGKVDLTMSVCTGAFKLGRIRHPKRQIGHDASRLLRRVCQKVPERSSSCAASGSWTTAASSPPAALPRAYRPRCT